MEDPEPIQPGEIAGPGSIGTSPSLPWQPARPPSPVSPGPTAPSPINPAATPGSPCTACGSAVPVANGQEVAFANPSDANAIVLCQINGAFPSLSAEKEFAQLLRQADFTGVTDRQTMHSVLAKPETRYLARRVCFLATPYNGGAAPAYVVVPEDPQDLTLLVDTLNRPASSSEFDVLKGTIIGIAPPSMCAQQLPVLAFRQLYSFSTKAFLAEIPRPDKTAKASFEAAADELFHRGMQVASNATGPLRGLAYALLSYAGIYQLVAAKYSENSALVHLGVSQARDRPDRSDIHLGFVKRDTGFREDYCFAVNIGGPFEYLDEPLRPCFSVTLP
jgi:hypothetical protein